MQQDISEWYQLYQGASHKELENVLKAIKGNIKFIEMAPDVSLKEKLELIKDMRQGFKVVSNLLAS